jgi:hypothetical protein
MLTCGPRLAASGRERSRSWAALASWAGREGGPAEKRGRERGGLRGFGPKGRGEGFGSFLFFLFF